MNRFSKLIISGLPIIMLASCQKVENSGTATDRVEKQLTIEAVMADAGTKTSVDENGTVYWLSKDSISVFFGDYCVPFYSYNSKPSTTARFIGSALISIGSNEVVEGEEEQYIYWGVYPYQTHDFKYNPVRVEEGVMCFVDEKQSAAEGTFDRSTFVTVAKSYDYSKMSFYNVCGGVRFKLASSDIEMVTFAGNNGEELAGEVNVEMDAEGHPYVKSVYAGVKTVRLAAPEGECFKSGVWYYIVTLPAELSQGYTMKFISKSANKMAEVSTSSPVTVKRSSFGSLTNPDAGLQFTEYDGSEDDTQMPSRLSIKSMTPQADSSFAIEIKYPTYSTKLLCDKVGIYTSSPSSSIRSLSKSLRRVRYYFSGDSKKYQILTNEEQVKLDELIASASDVAAYSYKNGKFLQYYSEDVMGRLLSNSSVVRNFGDRTILAGTIYIYKNYVSTSYCAVGELIDGEDELTQVNYQPLYDMTDHTINDLWMSDNSCIMLCGCKYSSPKYSFTAAALPSTDEVNYASVESYHHEPTLTKAGNSRFILTADNEDNYLNNRIHYISENAGVPQLNEVFASDTLFIEENPIELGTETVCPLTVNYDTKYSDYLKLYEDGTAKRFTFDEPYEEDTDSTRFELLRSYRYDGKKCAYAISCTRKYGNVYTDFKLYEISYDSDSATTYPLTSIPDCEYVYVQDVYISGSYLNPYFEFNCVINGENVVLYLNCNTREVTNEEPDGGSDGGGTK